MSSTIQIKRSDTANAEPTALEHGEVALNIHDRKLWVGDVAKAPVEMLGTELAVADVGAGTDPIWTHINNEPGTYIMDSRYMNVIRYTFQGEETFFLYSNRETIIGNPAGPGFPVFQTDFVPLHGPAQLDMGSY